MASVWGRRLSRPPTEMARIVNALAASSALFDFSVYPRFSSLITTRDSLTPKRRPLTWLMRLIEDIYDARYAHDTTDIREDAVDTSERLSHIFPVFVVDFCSKRYGLRSLVDQTCWDLLYNVHALRKQEREVEIFARMLEVRSPARAAAMQASLTPPLHHR